MITVNQNNKGKRRQCTEGRVTQDRPAKEERRLIYQEEQQ